MQIQHRGNLEPVATSLFKLGTIFIYAFRKLCYRVVHGRRHLENTQRWQDPNDGLAICGKRGFLYHNSARTLSVYLQHYEPNSGFKNLEEKSI